MRSHNSESPSHSVRNLSATFYRSVRKKLVCTVFLANMARQSRPQTLAEFPEVWHDHQILPEVEPVDWTRIQSAFDAKLFRRGDKTKMSLNILVS